MAWLLASWLIAGSMTHAAFAPPPDGPVAFRRDQLPIDAATMSKLSTRLVAMARVHPMETPAQRRDVARMLALAIALDPLNPQAGKLVAFYQNHPQPQRPSEESKPVEMETVWKTIAWLESPDAGEHGRTLAVLLRDVAAVATPDDPRAKEKAAPASSAWDEWIPPLAAYETSVAPQQKDSFDVPVEAPVRETPVAIAKPAPLASATVRTVVWSSAREDGGGIRTPGEATLQMEAKPIAAEDGESDEKPEPLRIGHGMDELNHRVRQLLLARGEKIPDHLKVRITCVEPLRVLWGERRQPVSAAAAVLASAAVTGREPDALIIGEVDSRGMLSLPADFWKALRTLKPDNGRKLILPAAAMDWLPSLLAMDQAGFFFDHEVILAENFDQLLSLSAKSPDEETAKAMAQFADIRSHVQQGNVRDYVANSFVRKRLAELAQLAPWHASARLLLIQGSGQRPVHVSRAVLACELREAIKPMAPIAAIMKREWDNQLPTPEERKSLGSIHDKCREHIDRLAPMTERNDQVVHSKARDLTDALRALERDTRARGEDWEVGEIIRSSLRKFAKHFETVDEELEDEEDKALGRE